MLESLHPMIRARIADFDFGCAGDGNYQAVRTFSPLCERAIRKGEQYVETLTFGEVQRYQGHRPLNVISRHCAHCALTFFQHVKVTQ